MSCVDWAPAAGATAPATHCKLPPLAIADEMLTMNMEGGHASDTSSTAGLLVAERVGGATLSRPRGNNCIIPCGDGDGVIDADSWTMGLAVGERVSDCGGVDPAAVMFRLIEGEGDELGD